MKAVLCKSFGSPENLTLEEIEAPRPAKERSVHSVVGCRNSVILLPIAGFLEHCRAVVDT